ncbi:MAG: FkbM family methyltransferase [Nanobdellota archaeon]
MDKFIKESWEELLVKPDLEIRKFSWNSNIIKHFFPNFKGIFQREKSIYAEFAKPLAYILDGLYFLISGGNLKKTKYFHEKRNPLYRYFERKVIETNNKRFKKYVEGDRINIKGVYLPIIDRDISRSVPDEIFKIFLKYKDNYSYKNFDKLDSSIGEDPYCYIGKYGGDITIKPKMNVVDAGSWIGDFAAYASKKGANVYAFEPSPDSVKWLKKTAEMNGRITVIPAGLGDKEGVFSFENSGDDAGNKFDKKGKNKIKIFKLDNWARKNKIKIDFIKSDIEGFERNMLVGAKEVLKKDAPLLSICTYHLKDDPVVLKKIILKANPNYKIIQKERKLFAYVKK